MPTTDFGSQLKDWRGHRRVSQLELSAESGVSQRHVSFLETGRAKPSREMVLHLANALEVPLRSTNELLVSAGFAPVHRERAWDDEELAHVRHVIRRLLEAHEPFPAYVIDGGWNLFEANGPALQLVMTLAPGAPPEIGTNIIRLSLHPDGLRPRILNWGAVAPVLLGRLRIEVSERPGDQALGSLLAEVEQYPDVAGLVVDEPSPEHLLVPLDVDHPAGRLSLFTTITSIASPGDVTLEEMRLETLLPADPESEQRLRSL